MMWCLHTTTTMEDDRESTFTTTKDFIQVKVDHFKAKAKNALEGGRYKEAYETYTKCLDVLRVGDGAERSKVLCNRSMAYFKAANFKLALKDADTAVALTPTFGKAWWRKGAAHVGLRQYPLALAAYKMSLKHQPQVDRAIEEEHVKVMNRTISQFTREQIGEWVLEVLDDYEAREMMKPAHLETVTSLEMTEAMFCQVKDIDEMSKKPGDYYRFVQHWNMYPMSLAMAYTQRASMYRHALCFKQARADAAMALMLLQDDPSLALTDDEMFFTYKKDSFTRVYTEAKVITKAWAWYELGKAYEEQRGTGDQRSAAKCFSAVTELPIDYPTFANAFKIMCEGMKDVDMGRVLSDVNDQYEATEYGLRTVPKATAYIVSVHAHFPHGSLVKFDSHVRNEFRSCVADAADIKKQDVLIESVKQSLMNDVKCIVVKYRILVGEVEKKAQVSELITN
jgi:tetratricopeptide (TPR) repeat protein